MTSEAQDYKYIYFVAPSPKTLYRTASVKECPTDKDSKLDCLVKDEVKSCEGIKFSATTFSNTLASTCAFIVKSFLDKLGSLYLFPTKN